MIFLRLAVVSILFNLCGCLTKTQGSSEFIVNLHASADINKNNYGEAAPLHILIYKVKSIDNFNALSSQELMDPDSSVSSDTYLKLADTMIQPGQTASLTLPLERGDNRIGIVAAYRDVASSRWMATTRLRENSRSLWLTPFTHSTPYIDVMLEKSRIVILGRKRS